jgi:hypothetical protein
MPERGLAHGSRLAAPTVSVPVGDYGTQTATRSTANHKQTAPGITPGAIVSFVSTKRYEVGVPASGVASSSSFGVQVGKSASGVPMASTGSTGSRVAVTRPRAKPEIVITTDCNPDTQLAPDYVRVMPWSAGGGGRW